MPESTAEPEEIDIKMINNQPHQLKNGIWIPVDDPYIYGMIIGSYEREYSYLNSKKE